MTRKSQSIFKAGIAEMPLPNLALDNPHLIEEIIRAFSDFSKKNEEFHIEIAKVTNERNEGYLQCVSILEQAAKDSKDAKEISQEALTISRQTAKDVELLKSEDKLMSKKLDDISIALEPLAELNNQFKIYIAVKNEVAGTVSLGKRIASQWRFIAAIGAAWSIFTGHAASLFSWAISILTNKI